jgi:glycosyltransferase involved in cell wall biosynthesis
LRVVVVHNRYRSQTPSGENRVVDLEVAALRERGIDVLKFEKQSDDIQRMNLAQRAMLPISPIFAPLTVREFAKALARFRPDVVHVHNVYPLISPTVIRVAHRAGVPVVHTVHNYRQVCVAGSYFRDGRNCTECRGRRVGLPAVRHACYRGSRLQSVAMVAALATHRTTWRSVDRVIVLNPEMRAHMLEYGVPRSRIVIKENAVPDPGEHSDAGSGFLFVGYLSDGKGIRILLDAWRSHPDGSLGTLRIAGDGPLRSLVESVARMRSDIEYLGLLSPESVRDCMRSAEIIVVPSVLRDVSPVVVLEALANGRPVLGTSSGGIAHIIGADDDACPDPPGWIAEPNAQSLSEMLVRAKVDSHSRGAQARRRYLSHFDPAKLATALIDIYARVSNPPTPVAE